MKLFIKSIVCFYLLLFYPSIACAEQLPTPYVFGDFPYISPEKIQRHRKKLLSFLQAETGHKFNLQAEWRYADTLMNARDGLYDIAFVPEHFAASLISDYGYEALIRFTIKDLSPVLITHIDSSINKIEDIRHSVLIMPDLLAHVSMVVINELEKDELVAYKDFDISVKVTHERVLMAVLNDKYKAGVVASSFTYKLAEPYKSRLKIIKKYAEIAAGVMVINKHSDLYKKYDVKKLLVKYYTGGYANDELERWQWNLNFEAIDDLDVESLREYIPD